ncbi:hypothetical protein [Rubrivirga sp.]|uniref:hypothetical protein n=1 Tax=Rubrivirga sp. TaxID=1885344 RepID=UPI003C73AD8F
MKHYIHTGLAGLLLLGGASLTGCDSFVEDIDGPVDRVVGDSLDSQGQIPFLITGVKEGFNDSYDQLATLSDLLADVGQFNPAVQNSTFPTFGEIDRGEIELDNNSNDNAYDAVNEYRFSADDLLRRVNETIEFSDDEDGAEARRAALYSANFHGGVARYFLGTYYSVDGQNGAAPISEDQENPSAPIPTAELYAQADAKLAEAAGLAATDYDRRVINTLRARIALFGGDRDAAANFAQNGLVQTDEPYSGRYTSLSTNAWWIDGGRGRTQISINDRFVDLDSLDSRSLVEIAPPRDAGVDPGPFYRQALYLMNSDPLPFLTWQENALILAEADIFDGGDDNDARTRINAVRTSRGLADLEDGDAIDQDLLIATRDRELFTLGLRLVDQRRFGIFHLGPDKQRFFPLPQTERNANPNI